MGRLARVWICMILVVLTVLATAAPAFAASYDGRINKTTKVYQKASRSSASMKIAKGTKCTVLAMNGSWAKVKRSGVTAYIPVEYVTLDDRIKVYADRDTKVYAKASSSSRSARVAVNTDLYIVGRDGDYWCVENKSGKVTAFIKVSHTSWDKVAVKEPVKEPEKEPEKETTSWKDEVVMMDWYDGGSSVLKRGSYAYIYDCSTGIQIKIKRMGGSNHMDIEPATAEDTAKLLKMAGGEFNWDSRAVILKAGGKYVACAINTMPHGDETILDNNYEGQFCLHMIDSRTHGSDTINPEHQKAIEKAYAWSRR